MHFSLRDDNLVVRVQDNQRNEILELIPASKLLGDLPPALVRDHAHWLNLSAKIIEIRPLEQAWETSSEHWRIECASGQYRMYKGREALVDIRSPTWALVSKCFECLIDVDKSMWIRNFLNESRNLLITMSPIDPVQSASMQQLSVTLPRYGLSFFVNEKEELESRDFKDMVYDEDQCVGALFGLEHLLVLRPKTHITGALVPEALIPRRVLIPCGFPKKYGNHEVRINLDSAGGRIEPDDPSYHTYDVDTELGCLIGNGSLMSMLYLAYLHAMTSSHRPDPLTGKTGVQAALCLLQSAGLRSIMCMNLKVFVDPACWTSTQYPQINVAYKELRKRYFWNHDMHSDPEPEDEPVLALEENAARRAAYLFPSNALGPSSLEPYDESKFLTTRIPAEPGPAILPPSISSGNECLPGQISLDQLLCNLPAPELPARCTLLRDSQNTSSDDIPLLDQLFSSLRANSSFQREYLARLDTSAQSVCLVSQMTHKVAGDNLIEALQKHYVQCRVNYLDSLKILKKTLGPTIDPYEQTLDRFRQWPPITADVLLRYLASASLIDIPPSWKKCLTSLAILLLELQHSRRLLRFALDGLEEELLKELENEGDDGWNAEEHPDWLLIQVGLFQM